MDRTERSAAVTTRGFAILPHEVSDTVPQDIKGAVRSVYPALHRHGWGSEEGSWASIKTLMDESGFGRDGVRAALRWLTSEGWVTREERPGYTPRYRVRIEDPKPPNQSPARRRREQAPLLKTVGAPPTENRRGTPTENRRGPLLKSVGEQEPINKNPRTRKQEDPPSASHSPPPLTAGPATRGADAPRSADASLPTNHAVQGVDLCPDPDPGPAKPPRKQAKLKADKDRFASKQLPADAIPNDLLDCQQLLPRWWAVKPKGRSEGAFDTACDVLRRCSPDERRQMLETAIMGHYQGLHPPKPSGTRFRARNLGGCTPDGEPLVAAMQREGWF